MQCILAYMQDCPPPVDRRAIPHEQYSQHMQSYLRSCFCRASGLSEEQARNPETLQQGIAKLVSALVPAPQKPNTTSHKVREHVRQAKHSKAPDTGAATSGRHESTPDPSWLRPDTARASGYEFEAPTLIESKAAGDPLSSRASPAGLSRCLDLEYEDEGPGDIWQQDRARFSGGQGISLGLADLLGEAALAESPQMPSPSLRQEDRPHDWLDSILSPSNSQGLSDWLREDGQGNMRSRGSGSPDLSLTEDAEMPGMSPLAQPWGHLPSRSPQLADVMHPWAADSLPESSVSFDDCLDMDTDEQSCPDSQTGLPDEDLGFLETGYAAPSQETYRSGIEHSNLQKPRSYEQPDNGGSLPGSHGRDWLEEDLSASMPEGGNLEDTVSTGRLDPDLECDSSFVGLR